MRKILMNFSILGVFWYFSILGVFCILILKISKFRSQDEQVRLRGRQRRRRCLLGGCCAGFRAAFEAKESL